jgi:hypothetical protein
LSTTSFGRGLLDDADAATVRITLGGTTIGSNIFTAANPGAIRFMRVNADNSVSFLDAASFLAAIGGGQSVWGGITGTLSNQTDLQSALDAKQPLDADLTAVAALTTTAFGRGLLDDADATAARVSLGLVIGSDVLSPGGNGSALTGLTFTQLGGVATDAQIPAAVARDAEVAAAFQPLDGDLTALAAVTGTNTILYRSATNVWSPVTIGANLTFSGGTLSATGGGGGGTWGTITGVLSSQTDLQTALDARQPLDADLTSISSAAGTNTLYYRSAASTWSPVTIGPNLTFTGGTLAGTGAGGVAWGGISGTLSTQTDLQAVLDAKQPLDADLTAIAALTTTTFGRSLLDDANTTAAQSTLGLVIGTNVLAPNGDGSGLTGFTDSQIPAAIARDAEVAAGYQPLDSDLTAIAALTTTSFGRSLLDDADNIAARVTLGLVIGTDVLSPTGNGSGLTGFIDAQIPAAIARDAEVAAAFQPLDADLTSLAAISATGNFYYRSAANTWTPVTVGSGLSFTSGTLTATAGGGGTVTATAGALTNNAIMLGAGSVDSKVLGSLGTTTTVLHGNAAGSPSFAPVTFAELSGTISSSQIPTTIDFTGKTLTGGTFVSNIIVGASGAVGAMTPTYSISAQNNATASYMEILNNGGAGKGAFFGMATNNFELWNYQGGPIIFYTNTTPSTGSARVKIDQTGILSALANFDVSNGALSSGHLDIYEDSDFGTNFARFQVPSLVANTVYTLPPDDGNSGDRLTTDGSGVLTWAPAGGGTPGGTNTQVQFNDSSAFGGDSAFTYDKTLDILTVPTLSTTSVNAGALEFEGATADAFETVITAIDPTADRVVQLPNANTIIPVYNYVATYTGFTGPHTITFPDANFTAARTDAANTFTGLQQFTPTSTLAGLNVGSVAGDPSTPTNGGVWYDSTGNFLRARINGVNVSLGAGGSLPGGINTQVQFNDGGILGGDTGFAYDKTTDILTVPTVSTTAVNAGSLEFEGATADAFETVITVVDPTADRTVTLPNADTKLPIYTQHLTYSGPTAARTVTYPDSNFTAARTDAAQTFTGLQQFTPTATLAGLNVGSVTGDPSTPSNGGLWYDSTGNLLRARVNGATITLGATPTLGTGVATFLATPSSANLRAALTDETGAGPAMFTRTGVLRTVYVNAGMMIPRTTNGAATGTVQTTTNAIMYDSFDFDSTTEEGVGFWWTPPQTYNAGTLTAKFHWTCAAGTGNVKWDIAARCYSDDDAIDQALGTEQTAGTDALLAVGDMHISPTTPALTVGGTAVANRPIYFQVTRDTATDTLSADAKLLGVTIEYTESATEPSAQ